LEVIHLSNDNGKRQVRADGVVDKVTKRMARFKIEGGIEGVLYLPKEQAVGIAGLELVATLKPGK